MTTVADSEPMPVAAVRRPARPALRANRSIRVIGLLALLASAVTLYLGLVVSPPARELGQSIRLLYVHPAAAIAAYLGYGLCAASSLAYLWPRTRSPRWDLLSGAAAEVGTFFCALTIVTGSIWGRATWGVWWTWDARLTLTALLFVLFLGYLALRRTGGDLASRAKRCAIAGVLFTVVVPIDHYATTWWNTLHPANTVLRPNPLIHGLQLWTFLLSFVAYTLIFVWLVAKRYHLQQLEDRLEREGFSSLIAARRAEAALVATPAEPVTAAAAPKPPAGWGESTSRVGQAEEVQP